MKSDACICFPCYSVVPVLITGENSVGNKNYDQLAQLNSQIEIKHITIQTSNKPTLKYLQDNSFCFKIIKGIV